MIGDPALQPRFDAKWLCGCKWGAMSFLLPGPAFFPFLDERELNYLIPTSFPVSKGLEPHPSHPRKGAAGPKVYK